MREFDCKGTLDNNINNKNINFTDSQFYVLNIINSNPKIFILPPNGFDVVPITGAGKDFSIVAQRGKPLNLTCYATIGCNDSGYKLGFETNITSGHFEIVPNLLDRSRCLHGFNELLNFTQSMIVPEMNANGSMIQCEIKFGTAFITKSPRYFVYFAGKLTKKLGVLQIKY